jgi:hypothetical protein
VSIFAEAARVAPAEHEILQAVLPRMYAGDRAFQHVWIQAIPENLLEDIEWLAALASAHVVAHKVKLTTEVVDKMRSQPLGGSLEFRPGDADDDPLRLAALTGVVLALCDSHELRRPLPVFEPV